RPKLEKLIHDTELPSNIILTGFLPHEAFDQYLFDADAVMDLTTRPDCMVCGAYEATAAETPIILSRNDAMQNYFFDGAIFIDNKAVDIERGIKAVMSDYSDHKKAIQKMKRQILQQQKGAMAALRALVS